MYIAILKRSFDLVAGLIAFIILFPFFILCTFLLLIANTSKPFFLQSRPGKNEKIFTLIKFKTMNDKKDERGNLLPDEQRLTVVGKFIRKTSLDEIPQLINVLKGEMSLVGPRPLLIEYLSLYNQFEKRRHEVKPGITGWAQVNGRNAIGWKQKFEYDVWYVDHVSFSLDTKILWRTFIKVLKSEGITDSASATMQKFTGNTE
jgi:lipopolysaccharide/colanic/teichoic acid biosynthesis glycosyltransferase